MIVQYFMADGRCIIEKSAINARYIEMRDGDHPITNDSVWQDNKRRRQPIMVVFEGCLSPLGADMTEEDVISLLTEIELIKLGFKKPTVSKMWGRALARLFGQITKVGLSGLIFLFIAYFVIMSMIEGY